MNALSCLGLGAFLRLLGGSTKLQVNSIGQARRKLERLGRA